MHALPMVSSLCRGTDYEPPAVEEMQSFTIMSNAMFHNERTNVFVEPIHAIRHD